MDKVTECVFKVKNIIDAFYANDHESISRIAKEISRLEHEADLTKNDIRNNLPKNIFLPIDRQNLLQILSIQDSLADNAEDIGVLFTLKKLKILDFLKLDFDQFVEKNLHTFSKTQEIINALHELFQSSFGGVEAESVRGLIDDVAYNEHEADLIQRKILKQLFNSEQQLIYSEFHLWMKILETIGNISNLSEKLANCIRTTLETK